MRSRKVIIGVGGSSGSIYAKVLFDRLREIEDQWERVGVVMSDNAKYNWKFELGDESWDAYPFDFYHKMDFHAPFASGSARYDTMFVCPCSMGVLARIATGMSNDLMTRSADVILKERRRLIVVPRDKPFSLIHLRNMTTLAECGAHIVPAIPSFYKGPTSFEDLARTVIDRVLDLADFEIDSYRWGETVELGEM